MADCEHQEYQNQTDHLQQQQVLGVGTDEEIRQWLVEGLWKHWAEQCPRTRGNCSSTCPVIVITHALFNCIVLLYSIVSSTSIVPETGFLIFRKLTLHNNLISRWAACEQAKKEMSDTDLILYKKIRTEMRPCLFINFFSSKSFSLSGTNNIKVRFSLSL